MRTVWILENGQQQPRLVTAYPLQRESVNKMKKMKESFEMTRELKTVVLARVGFKVFVNRILIEAGRRLPPTFNYVRDAPALVAAGVLPSEVASVAEEKGWRTRTGRPWTARQVLDTIANLVYSGRFRTPDGTRPGTHKAILHQDTFDQCARIIAGRRTGGPGTRRRRKWSAIEGKVCCAQCGRWMGIHTVRNGCVLYCYFRCRSTAGGQRPCTGTQVLVAQIESQVRSIFLAPGEHLCRQRGRPTRAMATLFSLGEVLPMLDPATERKLIHDVV